MPKIEYVSRNFQEASLNRIAQVNEIIQKYTAQGYNLTLRQLYYRLVALGIIPNTYREYKNIGALINNARLAGLIDWYALEDRTRGLRSLSHWTNPTTILESARRSFRIDHWKEQDNYVEVWVEKDALVSVIGRVCDRWDTPFMSTRGYISQSEMWAAAMRMNQKVRQGKQVFLIHLADHDPSGVDMTRDLKDRLVMFNSWVGTEVNRIALTMDQIQAYSPPPYPVKLTDSRSDDYMDLYGDDSWELDALEPTTLDELIENTIVDLLDMDIWQATLDLEASMFGVIDQGLELVRSLDEWQEGWGMFHLEEYL